MTCAFKQGSILLCNLLRHKIRQEGRVKKWLTVYLRPTELNQNNVNICTECVCSAWDRSLVVFSDTWVWDVSFCQKVWWHQTWNTKRIRQFSRKTTAQLQHGDSDNGEQIFSTNLHVFLPVWYKLKANSWDKTMLYEMFLTSEASAEQNIKSYEEELQNNKRHV